MTGTSASTALPRRAGPMTAGRLTAAGMPGDRTAALPLPSAWRLLATAGWLAALTAVLLAGSLPLALAFGAGSLPLLGFCVLAQRHDKPPAASGEAAASGGAAAADAAVPGGATAAVSGGAAAADAAVPGADDRHADLRAVFDCLPESVLVVGADRAVRYANPHCAGLLPVSPQAAVGRRLREVLRHPDLHRAVDEAFAADRPVEAELALRRPDRTLGFVGRRLTLHDGPGVLVVLHDVTELRRLERLRHDFFTSVSHELKTPLAGIKAFTETLLADADIEPAIRTRFLGRIDQQADRLHSLVMDMLMLARVESADDAFDRSAVSLDRTAADCVESFRRRAADAQVRLELHLAAGGPVVLADAEGLTTLLGNLIDNAIKYTPAGGQVTVRTEMPAPPDGGSDHGGVVRLAVADSGVGIPAADLDRIFERFYRVDKARSRVLGGTGLGLSIVKHLAQTFGGRVAVASRLGRGTTFTVELPLHGAGTADA